MQQKQKKELFNGYNGTIFAYGQVYWGGTICCVIYSTWIVDSKAVKTCNTVKIDVVSCSIFVVFLITLDLFAVTTCGVVPAAVGVVCNVQCFVVLLLQPLYYNYGVSISKFQTSKKKKLKQGKIRSRLEWSLVDGLIIDVGRGVIKE